jgi:hypothetical protein
MKMKNRIDFFADLNKKIMIDMFTKFLTDKQLERALRGEDIWLYGINILKDR